MGDEKPAARRRDTLISTAVSLVAITIASAAWISGAMIVAFPQYALSMDVGGLLRDFLTRDHHALALLILLFADIFIAVLVLNDVHVRNSLTAGRRVGVFILFLLLYLLVALLGPTFFKASLEADPFWIGLLALFAVGVPRGMAYAPPQRAVRVGRLT